MISRVGKRFLFFISPIVILYFIVACQQFSFGREEESPKREADYTIDPNTILESIANGKMDVFTLESVTHERQPLMSSMPVQWSQSDYSQIAQALHQYVWNEPLEDWSFGSMQYGMDCQDVSNGPQYAYFGYYKVTHYGNQTSRVVHEIYILHEVNSVHWVETVYSPQSQNWQTLDLAKVKVFVSNALAIAEMNGGSEMRSSVEDKCKIMLSLAPAAEYSGLQVLYSNNQSFFLIYIDPFSGKYQIMNDKTK